PHWYAPVSRALGSHGLAGHGTRVMLEKPLGHDRASAAGINTAVAAVFAEEQVFRVDHYLGKEGVQNLLALRFGNALFEPLWNARHIEQVQISVAETVGVEGRGDYYDGSGALRDMLQNHLLQLLSLVAAEPPSRFEPTAVRNEKLKVLHALRPIGTAEIVAETFAGQYAAGAIDGVAVPGYRDELGRDSDTETFVALRAQVDNWRWKGVPFYLRTGKRMPTRCTEIYLQFRGVPHSISDHGSARLQPNALVIRLQPDEHIELRLMNKTPGLDRQGLRLSQVALDLDMQREFAGQRRRPAYERLYLDALEGNGTLFVRRDETEAAWAWVDGIRDGWNAHEMAPRGYQAGTWGPARAVTLAERHGHARRGRGGHDGLDPARVPRHRQPGGRTLRRTGPGLRRRVGARRPRGPRARRGTHPVAGVRTACAGRTGLEPGDGDADRRALRAPRARGQQPARPGGGVRRGQRDPGRGADGARW